MFKNFLFNISFLNCMFNNVQLLHTVPFTIFLHFTLMAGPFRRLLQLAGHLGLLSYPPGLIPNQILAISSQILHTMTDWQTNMIFCEAANFLPVNLTLSISCHQPFAVSVIPAWPLTRTTFGVSFLLKQTSTVALIHWRSALTQRLTFFLSLHKSQGQFTGPMRRLIVGALTASRA